MLRSILKPDNDARQRVRVSVSSLYISSGRGHPADPRRTRDDKSAQEPLIALPAQVQSFRECVIGPELIHSQFAPGDMDLKISAGDPNRDVYLNVVEDGLGSIDLPPSGPADFLIQFGEETLERVVRQGMECCAGSG